MKTSTKKFNQEQYDLIIQKGAKGWNDWYLSQPYCFHKNYDSFKTLEEYEEAEPYLENIELEGADFSGMDLRGIKFGCAMLADANFENCNLEGSEFISCCLVNANFRNANLERAKMGTSFVAGVDFRGANLKKCDITKLKYLSPSFIMASDTSIKGNLVYVFPFFDEEIIEKIEPMGKLIVALDDLINQGIIKDYAVTDGVAMVYHIYPVSAINAAIFFQSPDNYTDAQTLERIQNWARQKGYEIVGKFIKNIWELPTEFIPAKNELIKEAIKEAIEAPYRDKKIKILSLNYLIATLVQEHSLLNSYLCRIMDVIPIDRAWLERTANKHGFAQRYSQLIEFIDETEAEQQAKPQEPTEHLQKVFENKRQSKIEDMKIPFEEKIQIMVSIRAWLLDFKKNAVPYKKRASQVG